MRGRSGWGREGRLGWRAYAASARRLEAVRALAERCWSAIRGTVAEERLQALARATPRPSAWKMRAQGRKRVQRLISCARRTADVRHLDPPPVAPVRRRALAPRMRPHPASEEERAQGRVAGMFSSAIGLPVRISSASGCGFSTRRLPPSRHGFDSHSTSPRRCRARRRGTPPFSKQRLQHERRQQRVGGRGVELQVMRSPLAQRSCSGRASRSRRAILVGSSRTNWRATPT